MSIFLHSTFAVKFNPSKSTVYLQGMHTFSHFIPFPPLLVLSLLKLLFLSLGECMCSCNDL